MESIALRPTQSWAAHRRGSSEYRRLLAALFCAGIATFAQLYPPQGVLPQISADLGVGAASASLMVSAWPSASFPGARMSPISSLISQP